MKYLIRFISKNAAGSAEVTDKVISAPVITIGRATDQVVHLKDRRARLQHATIADQADGVHISSSALSGVSVNGTSQRDCRLKVGDTVEIAANILRIIDAPDGIDFAFSFELSDTASSEHFVTDWSAPASGVGGWSKRRLSWSLVAIVALFTFLVPWFVFENVWLAGPVHSAHSSIADECDACHVSAFQRVPDETCAACHMADPHVAQPATPVLGGIRCASCHAEHNEPQQLVNRHQDLCADCHENMPAEAALEDASDFMDAHPPFNVSLLLPAEGVNGDIEWTSTRMLLSEAPGSDQSNLIFDHAVHLDEAGIIASNGRRVIECSECHRPEPGGARMQAISMDEHCSDCHTLSFDPDDPGRSVPHGDAETVLQSLVEYYSARLLGGDPDAGEQRLRRPGQALSRAERDRAAAEARVQALQVAEDLFERRACTNCHEVTRTNDDEIPWQVAPVQLTKSFFPRANFSHATHDTEVTSCDSCHNASTSIEAHDVLIPGIETCRDCHGSGFASRNDASQTPSTCIMCHSFHFASKGEQE